MATKKSQDHENDLGLSMIETLSSSEVSNITQDMLEVAIDSIIKDGILRDIPVISTITGITKTVITVRDKLLIRKIASFLFEIQNITEKERKKFIDDLDNDPNNQRKIGENLLLLLERLDDLDKPTYIAKLFKAYLKENISYHQFLRFSSVIDRMLMQDLKDFLSAFVQNTRPDLYAEYLYPFGLSKIVFDDDAFLKTGSSLKGIQKVSKPALFPQQNPLQFELSDVTFLFVQILIDKKINGMDYIAQNRQRLKFDQK